MSGTFISTASAALPTGCATCEELANAQQAGIFVATQTSDPANKYLQISAYYDDPTATPTRQPLANSILIVDISNLSGFHQMYKTYTDDKGNAGFNFNKWDGACINFRVMYCPYCLPTDVECEGFKQCINLAGIDQKTIENIPGGKTEINKTDDIAAAPDANAPGALLDKRFLPDVKSATYCAPPPPQNTTPAMCFPLILIFTLLSGAIYMTGRNPFAGFNSGGQHMGQHIKYRARGRGDAVSGTSALLSGIQVGEAVVSSGKDAKTGAKVEGFGARLSNLAKREAGFANARGLLGIVTLQKGPDNKVHLVAAQQLVSIRKGIDKHHGGGTSGGTEAKGGTTQVLSGQGQQQTTALSLSQAKISEIFGIKEGAKPVAPLLTLRTLAGFAMLLVNSTMLGRQIDMLYYAKTGQSFMDAIFIDREKRIIEAKEAIKSMLGPEGKGLRINPDGKKEMVLLGETPNRDAAGKSLGTTTFTIGNDLPAGDGRTANGQVNVTINDKTGKIESVSYIAIGVSKPTKENPEGLAIVAIKPSGIEGGAPKVYATPLEMTKDKDGKIVIDVTAMKNFVTSPPASSIMSITLGLQTTNNDTLRAATRAYADISGPGVMTPGKLMIGEDGSKLVAAAENAQATMRQTYQGLAQDCSFAMKDLGSKITEGIEKGSPGLRSDVRIVREGAAATAFEVVAASVKPGAENDALFMSREGKAASIIELRPLETAAQRVYDGATRAGVPAVSATLAKYDIRGQESLTSQSLNALLVQTSVTEIGAGTHKGRMPEVGAESTRTEPAIVGMLEQRGVKHEEAVKIAAGLVGIVEQTRMELKTEGCNDKLIDKIMSAPIGEGQKGTVTGIVNTGRLMSEDKTLDMLAANPKEILTSKELPPTVRDQIREYTALSQLAEDAGRGAQQYQSKLEAYGNRITNDMQPTWVSPGGEMKKDRITGEMRPVDEHAMVTSGRREFSADNTAAFDSHIEGRVQVYGDTRLVAEGRERKMLDYQTEYIPAIKAIDKALISGNPADSIGLEKVAAQMERRVTAQGVTDEVKSPERIRGKLREGKETGDFETGKKGGDIS